ncbi:MAG: hypothetical protein E7551_01175 [Ruminococcaceae bacterium]|nr:hypothetical protein [Oscillospiraceae bacterium]
MFNFSYKKLISIFCSLLIIAASFVSAFTLANAAPEVIIQDFENHTGLKNVKYFTVYEASSSGDTNVYEGSKSLKWTTGSGTDAVSFWQSGMDLTAGQLYKLEIKIKPTAANANTIVLKHLTTRDNGWANNGTNLAVNISSFTAGEWNTYETYVTAETKAMGMYIYGSADMYFDYIKFTPIVSQNVTVTLNTATDQGITTLTGAVGSAMTMPTLTKEGYYFAGWYSDAEFKNLFEATTLFPEANTELYAKWLPEGYIIQDFENNYTFSGGGFSLYTATDENDENVKDGTKSLKWTHTSGSKAISLYPGKDLVIGQAYKLEIWIKAVTSTGSGIDITQLNDVKNGWSYSTNTRITLPYFGTSYDSVNQWKRFEYTFTAEKKAMGILLYGSDDFYFDSISWTPVKADVTVNIVTNNESDAEPLKGAPGAQLTLPTLTKAGYYFAGWYLDSEFKVPFTNITAFPEEDTTIYAKWLSEGYILQNFENYNNTISADTGFSIYTATDENDENVKDGTKSLKWAHTNGSKVVTLYPDKNLTVGETYRLEMWVKAVTSTGSGIDITQLNDAKNGWSYSTNTRITLPYFGTSYDSVNQWKRFEYTFTAEAKAMGILLYGADDFYFDSISWTALEANIQVDIVTNNGTTCEPLMGASGMELKLPTLTKEGYYFAGWFKNAEFTKPLNSNVFPAESTTLYAKWLENGAITQNFESYDQAFGVDSGFELYTATDSNDTNVYEGEHSLFRTNFNKTRVATISDQYSSLTVGKAYRLTFKLKVVDLGTGGEIQFTDLSVRDNPWSYSKLAKIRYIGTDYAKLNEWVEISYIFIAEKPYFGIASWGNISYYVDDFNVVEVPIVTVNFEMGEGEAKESMVGAAGAAMTVENPTPPEGKAFGGWYSDADFTSPFAISTFPDSDLTLYARWIKAGTFEQDYETWPNKAGAYLTSDVFSIYTATNENDPNVYSGKHSMHYNVEEGNRTYALAIFDEKMGKLTVGEKYYVSIRFKLDKVYSYNNASKTQTYHSIYYTTQQSNVWTYTSQGPIGRFDSSLFSKETTKLGDKWAGTANMVTVSDEKDQNGWITMTYEIEAAAPYIALYMTGPFSIFIDYITIEPLPSGVIATDYAYPYSEEFYNILAEKGIEKAPNKNEKNIYKLELAPRGDYVLTASLMQGVYGNSKVYLAWDSEGKNMVENSLFEGNATDYKLYSARIMTDLTGVVYLVVEGAGAGSSEYFSLFKSQFGHEEDPNPYYVQPAVDYSKLPSKFAGASIDALSDSYEDSYDGDFTASPSTGDNTLVMPLILLLLTAISALLISRKRGICNE